MVWLRLLYCYPDYLTDELLLTIKEEPKICKYLDIPLQHISDPVLRAMGRRMRKAELYRLINKIRALMPEIILRSTFIVGFPGETKECYNELLAFLQDIQFERAGFLLILRNPTPRPHLFPGKSAPRKKRRLEKALRLQETILSAKTRH